MSSTPRPPVTEAAALQRYTRARSNLLWVILFTVINAVLLIADSGVMFLFSATLPYFMVSLGWMVGIRPVLIVCIVIAAIMVGLYALCWALCKTRPGWMVAALVFFALDTAFLLYITLAPPVDFSGILDILIHVWVLVSLFQGARFGLRLKRQPKEPSPAVENGREDTPPLRSAGYDPDALMLAEAEWQGNRISCRRTEEGDELIVNGFVLAEAPTEEGRPLLLSAVKDGSTVTVLMDASRTVYITVDGKTVASFAAPV